MQKRVSSTSWQSRGYFQVVANGRCSALFGSGQPLVIGPSERERRSRAKNGRALPEKLDKVLARQDHGRLKRWSERGGEKRVCRLRRGWIV